MIQISEVARKIRTLMAKQGITEGGLRAGVKGGGCSGLSYTFAWEKQPRLGDETFEGPDGSKIFVDKKSLLFLNGTVLDYDTNLVSKGVRVQQPERQIDLRLWQPFELEPPARPCKRARTAVRRSTRRAFLPAVHQDSPPPRRADYFSFSRSAAAVEPGCGGARRTVPTLSRQFHPDYFCNATPAERRASLERSSYLNDAYRTLKQPAARIEYLLKLEGLAPDSPAEASRKVPPALLEEVFALNEELDEIRELRASGAAADAWRGRLERARQPIEAKRVAHEAQLQELSARWDAAEGDRRTVLEALRDRFLERNYISNLLAGIEREISS